jgi:uncharacterized protein (UPF0371 family)
VGTLDQEPVHRIEWLMEEFGLHAEDRPVVRPARQAAAAAEGRTDKGSFGVYCGAAIQLRDGTVVTGCNSPLLHAAPSMVLNAIKQLAGIPHNLHLLSPTIVEAVANLKKDILHRKSVSLDLEETLIALSISSTSNPVARAAMEHLTDLTGCEVHLTHLPTPGDETGLRRLGVNLTCDPQFASDKLFVS